MRRPAAVEVLIGFLGLAALWLFAASLRVVPGFPGSAIESALAAALLGAVAVTLGFIHRYGQLVATLNSARSKELQLGLMMRVDPLTRLLNRAAFLDEFDRAVERQQRGDAHMALLMIDLDQFRHVNEAHGHGVGDAVLVETARRIAAFETMHTRVARIGGDEFAILIEDETLDELPRRIARRLCETLTAPVRVPQGLLRISATIGLADSGERTADSRQLLHRANIALNEAKRQARGSFREFEAAMEDQLRLRASLEADLRRALGAGEIVPYYQPLVALEDGRIAGFEVLARWNHPRHGLMLPAAFVPIAEETGRVGEMFFVLLARACADAKGWPDEVSIAVNVAPSQFAEPKLAARVLSILKAAGIDPARLELEITENALVDEVSSARLTLAALRDAGVSVALDDFGTGYSSLRHLNDLPIDRLKIDRLFIESARTNVENWKMVRALVQFAHALDLETTAEGIESGEVADMLRNIGCDIGQGYLFGEPMPVAAATEWMARLTASRANALPQAIPG